MPTRDFKIKKKLLYFAPRHILQSEPRDLNKTPRSGALQHEIQNGKQHVNVRRQVVLGKQKRSSKTGFETTEYRIVPTDNL